MFKFSFGHSFKSNTRICVWGGGVGWKYVCINVGSYVCMYVCEILDANLVLDAPSVASGLS